jgi:hypothetical protein
MAYCSELPSRLPVGTKFVIEDPCGGEDQNADDQPLSRISGRGVLSAAGAANPSPA